MMRINHKYKSTISIKMFIDEFGNDFSEHLKNRLLELEVRTVLKRDEVSNIFNLKHVEHLKYDSNYESKGEMKTCKKEYVYSQFAVIEGVLYFSEKCNENDKDMKASTVSSIYNSLDSKGMIFYEDRNLKKIDDSNIDYVVDSILSSCPEVSEKYKSIVKGMISRSEENNHYNK